MSTQARLVQKYRKEVVPALREEFGIKNIHQVPKLEKISLNMGFGNAALEDTKRMDIATKDMTMIAGQLAAQTKARVSVSNFKLRQGMRLGCRVTLRGNRMYEFLDRLINVVMPRIRDFRGIRKVGFDNQGNFSMGLDEIGIFPEVDSDRSEFVQGIDITFVIKQTSGKEQSLSLWFWRPR